MTGGGDDDGNAAADDDDDVCGLARVKLAASVRDLDRTQMDDPWIRRLHGQLWRTPGLVRHE